MVPEAVWMPNMGTLHPVPEYRRPSISRTEQCFGYKSDIVVKAENETKDSMNRHRPGQKLQAVGDAVLDMDRAILIEHRMKILQHNIDPMHPPELNQAGDAGETLSTPDPASATCDLRPGLDFFGHDLRGLYAQKYDDCCALCAHEPGCVAWTFISPEPDKGSCWLKDKVPKKSEWNKKEDGTTVSGVLGH